MTTLTRILTVLLLCGLAQPVVAGDLTPHQAKERKVNLALSNSFGFGGTNASLVLGAYT